MHLHVLVEIAGSGLRSVIEQRIERALGPFSDRISWVSACLQQVKVSSDSRIHECYIEAVLTTASVLEVEARAVGAEAAVYQAVERITRRVKAELECMQAAQERANKPPLPPIKV